MKAYYFFAMQVCVILLMLFDFQYLLRKKNHLTELITTKLFSFQLNEYLNQMTNSRV